MTSLDVVKERKRLPQMRGASVRRTSAMMVRVTEAQRRAIERRAAIESLSSSTWVRMIIQRELRNKPEAE